ncbi:TIGR01777 family oxidoreductase [Sungkyunkwania multivorans]|uniref:TIGR01777 family oxidoreductase n=1 Tax=Sungkyunkwania multivorans TaxID=1173618 RepID=A0ABW3D4I1_9FLAO
MKVLITGATGLIGTELVKVCHQQGIDVHYLTTSKNKIEHQNNYKGFHWDPDNGKIDPRCIEGVDTIINLAGATVAKRWTSSYKQEILESRLDTIDQLKQLLENNEHQVKNIVSASAIGIYEDSQTNYYSEESNQLGTGFLATVVKRWEGALDAIEQMGVAVSKIRIGLVLSDKGGALTSMAKPIKYFVGAAFGDGQQWQSWIHINDLARMFLFLAEKETFGVFNGVAPNPVSNEKLTNEIGAVLKRPVFLPNIPRFFMRLVLGEMSQILFSSHRVSSKKIESHGFHFNFKTLKPALQDLLQKNNGEETELAYQE